MDCWLARLRHFLLAFGATAADVLSVIVLRCRPGLLWLVSIRDKAVEIGTRPRAKLFLSGTFLCTPCESKIQQRWSRLVTSKCSSTPRGERMKYKSKVTVMAKRTNLRTGCTVPESGIYRVSHSLHRLPEEVTLLADQDFPRCSRCIEPVSYELVRSDPAAFASRGFAVTLYELPELSDNEIAS